MSDKKTATTPESPVNKGRLLIVDGEARHADSLALMINSWGYQVESASDGAKAAGILVTKPVDLVLLDLHMPASNGPKLMDFIRKRRLKTRVIAISGDPSTKEAIDSIKRGADDFIRKPVSPVTLLKSINQSLKRRARDIKLDGHKRKAEIKNTLHQLMFDVAPNLLFMLDARGCFRMVNNVFCKVTGYSKQELMGMHWKSLVEADEVERLHHVFEERRTTPDQFPEVEFRLKCKESSGQTTELKPRTVLMALQSRRLYSRQENKKTFFGTYGVARDITHYNKLEELNKYREFHDQLTGLPNRVLFDDYLSFALTRAKHSNTGLCLLNIVLDDLKQVNQSYGHTVGDICVKTLASRLKHQIRRGDTLARVDGSEFFLLLPNVRDEGGVLPLVEKIRASLTQAVVVDGKSIALQVSVGAAFYPRDGANTGDLLKRAKNGFSAPAQGERPEPMGALVNSDWITLIKS